MEPLVQITLEDYLREVHECPDEELTNRCGIYDNWPILLDADFDRVMGDLEISGKYAIVTESYGYRLLHFTRGTIQVQAHSRVGRGLLRGDAEDKRRQEQDYGMTLMLHPYQEKQMPEHPSRCIAIVAQDLISYANENGFPFCLTHVTGWGFLKEPHRVVYHP